MSLDEKALLEKKQKCPFCKCNMVRPRKNFCIGNLGEAFIKFPCSILHKSSSELCKHCKRYNDYECPNCHILLMYRDKL